TASSRASTGCWTGSRRSSTGNLRSAMAIEYADKVRRIPVYPAADGYASEGPIAKLASNESPYPPFPAVGEAVTKVLTGLNRYPDPTNSALRRGLADHTGVPAQRIAIGNG